MLFPYAELTLNASDVLGDANNVVAIDAPCCLELHDNFGLVAAQGGTGGLRFSAKPTHANSNITPIKATVGGRLFLPCAGNWQVTLVRWGAAGLMKVSCAVQRLVGSPLDLGAMHVLGSSQQSFNTQPTVDPTSTTIMTLAQRLGGVVAVAVNPLVTGERYRFGASPAGTLYDIQVAAGGRYVFKEQELPLAELNASVISGLGDNCKVVRYIV